MEASLNYKLASCKCTNWFVNHVWEVVRNRFQTSLGDCIAVHMYINT